MSATAEATKPAGTKKTFGKSTREVPHHSQKAKKWYPAEDEAQPRKVCRHDILVPVEDVYLESGRIGSAMDCANAIVMGIWGQGQQRH